MTFNDVLEQAEQHPDDNALIAALLVKSSQIDLETLDQDREARFYNLLAYVLTILPGSTHNALYTALLRALTKPPVFEYFQRRMEASADFWEMLANNAAAPVILALLCTHDDPQIAKKAAIALAYTQSEVAYQMLQRWLTESNAKKLSRAAQLALPYFSEIAAGSHD